MADNLTHTCRPGAGTAAGHSPMPPVSHGRLFRPAGYVGTQVFAMCTLTRVGIGRVVSDLGVRERDASPVRSVWVLPDALPALLSALYDLAGWLLCQTPSGVTTAVGTTCIVLTDLPRDFVVGTVTALLGVRGVPSGGGHCVVLLPLRASPARLRAAMTGGHPPWWDTSGAGPAMCARRTLLPLTAEAFQALRWFLGGRVSARGERGVRGLPAGRRTPLLAAMASLGVWSAKQLCQWHWSTHAIRPPHARRTPPPPPGQEGDYED